MIRRIRSHRLRERSPVSGDTGFNKYHRTSLNFNFASKTICTAPPLTQTHLRAPAVRSLDERAAQPSAPQ